MTFVKESVSIQKKARSGDGAGGKSFTWNVIAGGKIATLNLYHSQRMSELREEESTHGGGGPGIETVNRRFFTFDSEDGPFPSDVARDYQIVRSSGEAWRVLFVRTYEDTMQVDVELVQ